MSYISLKIALTARNIGFFCCCEFLFRPRAMNSFLLENREFLIAYNFLLFTFILTVCLPKAGQHMKAVR